MKRFRGICLFLISTLLVSCSDQIVYHSYHHFPKEGWRKSDTLFLDLHVTDSFPNDAEIIFLIRNQANYLYQDFHAILQHNIPDSVHWRSYKADFIMTDKDGKWNGSGWGGLYQLSVSLGEFHVPPGTYTFKVVHQMSDEQLQGINDAGILIKKERPEIK